MCLTKNCTGTHRLTDDDGNIQLLQVLGHGICLQGDM